jgi:pimeloyl-ACP methyl ester carboxylesterase
MPTTEREQNEITAANESEKQPVMFVHGLWLLAGSWEPWRGYFEERGFVTLAPGWPDDPPSVAEARANPDAFARKSVGQVTDHYAGVAKQLARKPIVIGHSFGGLITQRLAGMSLTHGAVAIDPAPFRGVLPLPLSALKAAFPALKNPLNRNEAIMLTYEQFRYAFANAVTEDEAKQLYDTYAVPAPALPLFQAAAANFNPKSETKVDTKNPSRGPLLITSGERDNTVPWAISNASYKRYKDNPASTEIAKIPNRGHSLTIDSGWREVADICAAFLERNGIKA